MTDKAQMKRTDALTELADKYNMTARDRTTLFKLYIAAAQLPPGWVAVPEEPNTVQLHAGLINEHKPRTASVWNVMKEGLASQYRKMVKARPPVPVPPPEKDDNWGKDGSIY